jgi:hypothetical protein
MLGYTIIHILSIIEHNGNVSSENHTDLFGEMTELLYRKHDKTSCGGRTCEIPCGQLCLNTVKLTRQTASPQLPFNVTVRIRNEQH